MSAQERFHLTSQEAEQPVVTMDLKAGESLHRGEYIDVSTENLNDIYDLFPEIDRAKVRVQIGGSETEGYELSEPDEQGIVTLHIGLDDASETLPYALSKHADVAADRPHHSSTTAALAESGTQVEDLTGSHGPNVKAAMHGGVPAFQFMEAVGQMAEHYAPGERRARKAVRAAKPHPVVSVERDPNVSRY
ncbi:MAG TPA: hypothetical protein VF597_03335 [Candidatus Saccharimonadales bacterium]|jgi:hypothetical protein